MYEVPAEAAQLHGHQDHSGPVRVHDDGLGRLLDDVDTAIAAAAIGYVVWRFKAVRVLVGLMLVYFALGTVFIEDNLLGLWWLAPAAGMILWGSQGQGPSPAKLTSRGKQGAILKDKKQ
jgi:hypothetical protein